MPRQYRDLEERIWSIANALEEFTWQIANAKTILGP